MGFDNPLLFPKFEGCLSFFSSFSGNDLICLLLVGLTSAPEETDFVLTDYHAANSALLLGNFPTQL